MKHYLIVLSLFLLSCGNGSSHNHNKNTKIGTPTKLFSTSDSTRNNLESDTNPAINDTIMEFIKENLYYSTLINLSFCQRELVTLLDKNDSCKKEWENKVKHLFTMYDGPFDNVSTGIEIKFFKDRLYEQGKLLYRYPTGYTFLMKSLPTNRDTSFSLNKYQTLMLRFKNAGGGDFSELSGIYYTFLITDGLKFIEAIKRNPECVALFRKWINNIEETEFVAYGADNVPPQILERKRNYLIKKYSFITDPLMREAIDKIKDAKIRSID